MQQQQTTDLEDRKAAAWPVAQAYATGKNEVMTANFACNNFTYQVDLNVNIWISCINRHSLHGPLTSLIVGISGASTASKYWLCEIKI